MMPPMALAAVWVVVGASCAVGHSLMLQRAVAGRPYGSSQQAKRAIVRGFGLRMVLYLPVLCLAASGGWVSSVAWLVGHWVARAVMAQRVLRGWTSPGGGSRGPEGLRGH